MDQDQDLATAIRLVGSFTDTGRALLAAWDGLSIASLVEALQRLRRLTEEASTWLAEPLLAEEEGR